MAASILTASRAREVLHYDKETGAFTWLVRTSNCSHIGSIAGTRRPDGYIVIRIDLQQCRAHRLAWLHVHGEWPSSQIDHIDGRRDNNAFVNLRDVSGATNSQNIRAPHIDNGIGILGVSRNRNRWRATIGLKGKQKVIGTFDTPELAHFAYLEAKRQLHNGCTI